MGNNKTGYEYMRGENNPAKRIEVRNKIKKNHWSKQKGYINPAIGRKRNIDLRGKNNPNYGNKLPRKICICRTCKKEFECKEKENRIYCSMKCYDKKGINGPRFNGRMFRKSFCIKCNKKVTYRETPHLCKSCANSLQNNPNWQEGKSKEKYGLDWNENLKEYIRYKYNYICQICGKHQSFLNKKLHVHHIDENKKNCKIKNLIPLCNRCHMKHHRMKGGNTKLYNF